MQPSRLQTKRSQSGCKQTRSQAVCKTGSEEKKEEERPDDLDNMEYKRLADHMVMYGCRIQPLGENEDPVKVEQLPVRFVVKRSHTGYTVVLQAKGKSSDKVQLMQITDVCASETGFSARSICEYMVKYLSRKAQLNEFRFDLSEFCGSDKALRTFGCFHMELKEILKEVKVVVATLRDGIFPKGDEGEEDEEEEAEEEEEDEDA